MVATADDLKAKAALRAVSLVEDGMRVGLGTGTTAMFFVEALAQRLREGLDVLCVATSEATRAAAEGFGVPVTSLDEIPHLHLTVDGADEIDPGLRLIKGGGGALLREKIVATASDRMVVIADESKLVEKLGSFPLPIEVVSFGVRATHRLIEAMAREAGCGGEIRLRMDQAGHPFMTDQGNLILDCDFGSIDEPEVLAFALKRVPGVVEHGLFLGVADAAIIAGQKGVKVLEAPR